MARTEQFLPATSRIVIRQKSGCQWYNTKDEVILNMAKVEDATCPLTNNPVRRTVHKGITVYFQTNQIRTRLVLEEGDVDKATLASQMVLFHYDVHQKKFQIPYHRLYATALRGSESCWYMRADSIPYHLIAEMEMAGCTVHCDRQDREETEKIVKRSILCTIEKINQLVENARISAEEANAQLENSENEEGGITKVEAEKRHTARMKAIQKRMVDMVDALVKASTMFGINTRLFRLENVRQTATEIKSDMSKRAKAYKSGADKLAAMKDNTTAQAMAKSAQADEAPTFALTDLLREEGEEAAADELQEAFEK